MKMISFSALDQDPEPALDQSIEATLLDLGEYVHPRQRPVARERLVRFAHSAARPVFVRLPFDFTATDVEALISAGAEAAVLSGTSTREQVREMAAMLDQAGFHGRLVLELGSGAVLRDAEALATAHPAVSAIWYALADLLVDLRDKPASLYFYDSPEPRLASPEWTRSYLLTVARAIGLELWGQLDLTFAKPAPVDTLQKILSRAYASGFDVLVSRHPGSVALSQ